MIYVPRSVITGIKLASKGAAVTCCTKIKYKGIEISVATDTSCSETGDLVRSDLRMFTIDDKDITHVLWPELRGHEVPGSAENLRDTFSRIDALLAKLGKTTYTPPKGVLNGNQTA
jgi:hypothetical protein